MDRVVIDPGKNNLAILLQDVREIYFLKNVTNLPSLLCWIDFILKEKIDKQNVAFYFEKQFFNKNIYAEGILTGLVMSKFKKATVKRLKPCAKNEICKKLFSCQYIKAKSKKKLKTFTKDFFDILKTFKIFISNDNLNNTLKEKLSLSIGFDLISDLLLTKKTKFDDIVDVLLLFLYVTSKKL